MDPILKKRLTGTAVLVVLAALLLPLVLDGANEEALLADTRLPPPPAVPDAAALLEAPPEAVSAAETEIARDHVPVEPEAPVIPPVAVAPGTPPAETEPAPVPAPAVAAPAPVADPRLASLAEAWDVQLAAVSSPDGADRLRASVATAGYKARIVRAGPLYKVVVGPELRREDAEKLRAKLAADARIGKPAGMLVRYIP
ncbi:MAG: SPOR domain-containing protein [Pseudomonadota bacterium]